MASDARYSGKFENLRSEERVQRLQLPKLVDYVLAGIDGLEDRSLIDIGTGAGLLAEAFGAKGLEVTGVDVNEDFVRQVRQLLPELSFAVASAEDLPFGDEVFDVAYMGYVLHEAEDYQQAMDEAYRVCKRRLAVLEARHDVEGGGPPKHERLKPDFMVNLGLNAGFKSVDQIVMSNMVLLIFEK